MDFLGSCRERPQQKKSDVSLDSDIVFGNLPSYLGTANFVQKRRKPRKKRFGSSFKIIGFIFACSALVYGFSTFYDKFVFQ